MKHLLLALACGIIFIGCGENTTTPVIDEDGNTFVQATWNTDFEKFNSNLELLPSSAVSPVDYSTLTSFNADEWVITKKKETNFYISEASKTSMLSTEQEALDFCSVHPIDSQALHWRVPTNNELLVISELYDSDVFFWSSDTTSTFFGDSMDSVRLSDGFICQAQYVYNSNTEFGTTQYYCNEQLSGKFVGCVASVN